MYKIGTEQAKKLATWGMERVLVVPIWHESASKCLTPPNPEIMPHKPVYQCGVQAPESKIVLASRHAIISMRDTLPSPGIVAHITGWTLYVAPEGYTWTIRHGYWCCRPCPREEEP